MPKIAQPPPPAQAVLQFLPPSLLSLLFECQREEGESSEEREEKDEEEHGTEAQGRGEEVGSSAEEKVNELSSCQAPDEKGREEESEEDSEEKQQDEEGEEARNERSLAFACFSSSSLGRCKK